MSTSVRARSSDEERLSSGRVRRTLLVALAVCGSALFFTTVALGGTAGSVAGRTSHSQRAGVASPGTPSARPQAHIYGMVPAAPAGVGGTRGPRPSDFAWTPFAARGNLIYHGGPVMQTNTTYAIYWLPAGQTMSANYQSIINGFFHERRRRERLDDDVYGRDTQYYDGLEPEVFVQNTRASAARTSTRRRRSRRGAATASTRQRRLQLTGCVTDAQIQDEIDARAQRDRLDAEPDKLFFVFTPRSVGSCIDTVSRTMRVHATTARTTATTSAAARDVIYANQPYTETSQLGTARRLRPGPAPERRLGRRHAQRRRATSTTRRSPTQTATPGTTRRGNENGDKCAWTFGTPLGIDGRSAQYNQVIGTGTYYLQQEWSNASSSCVLGFGAPPPPSRASRPSSGASARQSPSRAPASPGRPR